MAVVETERHGQILVIRMNRPERLNALNTEMRAALAKIWTEFRHSKELEVAIFTGTGRGFCAGEDMKELAELATDEGRIVKFKDEKLAVYKDKNGVVHAMSPICTHVGCEVKWNNAELTWDCPCHGARYSYTGTVLNGPASKNLTKMNVRELVKKED